MLAHVPPSLGAGCKAAAQRLVGVRGGGRRAQRGAPAVADAAQQGRAGQSHVLVGKTSNWDCSLTEQQKLGFPTRAIVCRYKTRGNTAKDELTRTKKCAGHEAEACGALMSACGAILLIWSGCSALRMVKSPKLTFSINVL